MSSEVRMVEVGGKPVTVRIARAEGFIRLRPETIELIKEGKIRKGNVIAVAKTAAILAAKRTWELIPLCHPLPLTGVEVKVELMENRIRVCAEVRTVARTGVEMEALTAVCVGLLTIWDMVKEYEKDSRGLYPSTVIEGVRVVSKIKKPSKDDEP